MHDVRADCMNVIVHLLLAFSPVTRRAALLSASAFGTPPPATSAPDIDWYAHWSFFGLAPPPIEASVTYDELLLKIREKQIESLQIAAQHDCMIATTTQGHRLALLIPDAQIDALVGDSMDSDHVVTVLPVDPARQAIRAAAQVVLATYAAVGLLGLTDNLPDGMRVYGSMKQRADGDAVRVHPLLRRWLDRHRGIAVNKTLKPPGNSTDPLG